MKVSASGAVPGGRLGRCLRHLEGAHWLQTREVLGQQLENWERAGLAYQRGSLQTDQTAHWVNRAGDLLVSISKSPSLISLHSSRGSICIVPGFNLAR